MNLTKNTKVTLHSTAVAAGATVITPSTAIDMKGFESVSFLACFGAIVTGAATSIEVHQSDSSSSGFTALLGSKVVVADDADDKVAYVEINNPRKRYLKCVVNRATQNATLNALIALQSGPKEAPVTHDTTVSGGELHHAPAEGTA